MNQRGIVHNLILVIILIAAVVSGVYLVQQRTNLVPFAKVEDCPDLPMYCEEGVTRQCGGGYKDENNECQRACEIVEDDPLNCSGDGDIPKIAEPETTSDSCSALGFISCTQEQADNGWVVNNDGYMQGDICFRDIYRYETSTTEGLCCSALPIQAADQAECKITAQNNSSKILQKTKSCPDEGLVYCEEGKKIEKYNAKWNEEEEACVYDFRSLEGDECAGKSSGEVIVAGKDKEINAAGQEAEESLACSEEEFKKPYVDSVLRDNLIYYYAIITGTPERCVKADLTLPEFKYADGVDGGEGRRLFLCSGKDGALKWRVQASDGSDKLVQTVEQFSTDPSDPGFPMRDYVGRAEQMLGISL